MHACACCAFRAGQLRPYWQTEKNPSHFCIYNHTCMYICWNKHKYMHAYTGMYVYMYAYILPAIKPPHVHLDKRGNFGQILALRRDYFDPKQAENHAKNTHAEGLHRTSTDLNSSRACFRAPRSFHQPLARVKPVGSVIIFKLVEGMRLCTESVDLLTSISTAHRLAS